MYFGDSFRVIAFFAQFGIIVASAMVPSEARAKIRKAGPATLMHAKFR